MTRFVSSNPASTGIGAVGSVFVVWILVAHGGFALLVGRAASEPPPAVDTLLRRVLDQPANHSEYDAAFDTRYAHVRHRTFEVRNGDDQVLRREDTTLTNHVGQAKAEGDGDVAPPEARSRSAKAYRREDFRLNIDLLRRYRFVVLGEDRVDDRPVWVLEFEPIVPGPPAHDLKDRFLNKCAGRVWVDAQDAVVVRFALHLTEPMQLVGGLVGSIRRCETSFDRRRTPAGDWYTGRMDWRLEGRKVFARRIMVFHEERDLPTLAAPLPPPTGGSATGMSGRSGEAASGAGE
jgi:hypothetical protein